MTINVVTRPPGATGFVLLPRRWVVERTLAWLLRARRNVRDYERLPRHSEAALVWTAITLLTRRLTGGPRAPSRTGWTPARREPGRGGVRAHSWFTDAFSVGVDVCHRLRRDTCLLKSRGFDVGAFRDDSVAELARGIRIG